MSSGVLTNGDSNESGITVKQFLNERCRLSKFFSQIPDEDKLSKAPLKPMPPTDINLHDIPSALEQLTRTSPVEKRKALQESTPNNGEPSHPKKQRMDPPTTSNRYENSLLLTTQRFMMLKQITRDKILNLNDAADFLEVPKRRLYDITNVLEGIAIVEKIGKNAIRWRDEVPDHLKQQQLQEDVETLEKQEEDIDALIRDCKSLYRLAAEDPVDMPYAYIQRSDIRTLDTQNDTTSIAIKSVSDYVNNVEVQVADPYVTGGFQMIARNKSGKELAAYLCKNDNCATFEPSAKQVKVELLPVKEELVDETYEQGPSNVVKIEPFDDYVIPDGTKKTGPQIANVIETPGRGLYMSPLKPLMDPSILMPGPPTSSSGFIPIQLPPTPPMRPWNNLAAPPSLLELFPLDETD
ncbi:unnamed protein product [Caenorhabditis angaria]|uniref:E2F/DP family winged-helix DNA-binding domain-containing protein n=1 Tax=Caenorhabditis angaria TaxID=860376 RepID=A0A9P1NBX9_9PELO|nr:unnamed protein product [Caenorhabditis angaria]